MSVSKPLVDKELIDFVELPSEEFNCPICLGLLEEPYLTACCGNHFCKDCIDNAKKNNDKCPLCQAEPLNGVVNKHFKRKLNELKVFCTYKREGCKWKGDYGKLNQHLAAGKIEGECQFVVLKCPLSTTCRIALPRKSLAHHTKSTCSYRPFSCKHCGFLSSYHVVTTQHVNKCVNYPMPCPNKCSKQMYPRSQLKSHLALCPDQTVDCNFKEMGCRVTMKRHLLQEHLEANSLRHQMIMCEAFKSLQKDKEELEKKVSDLTQEISKPTSETDYWIKGFKLIATAMRETNWPLYISKMAEIAAVKPVAPLVYKVPFLLIREDCSRICVLALRHHRKCGVCDKVSHSHYKSPVYHSGPFYSHPNGYKIQFTVELVCHCLDCRARSFGLGEHTTSLRGERDIIANVIIDLYLLEGKFDAQLKWPFESNITITLLNEQKNSNHQEMTKTYVGNKSVNGKDIKLNTKQVSQPKASILSQIKKQLQGYYTGDETLKQLYREYCKYVKPDAFCFAFSSKKCITKFVHWPGARITNYDSECEAELFLDIKFS